MSTAATDTFNGPIIDAEDLWRTYEMGAEEIHALRGVTFKIEKGEYVAVMGPSGSGKSTLMNLIGCLDTPSSGTYALSGKVVSEMDDDELAAIRNREIGFVFQTFNLLPRATALHNVELPLVYAGIPREERIEKVQKALEMVDLGDRVTHKPSELSGGQRQRVAVARALVMSPSILLADEPTGNLDTVTGQDIMKLFETLHEAGHTIILVTHLRSGERDDVLAFSRQIENIVDFSWSLSAMEPRTATCCTGSGRVNSEINRLLMIRKNRFGASDYRIGMTLDKDTLDLRDHGRFVSWEGGNK